MRFKKWYLKNDHTYKNKFLFLWLLQEHDSEKKKKNFIFYVPGRHYFIWKNEIEEGTIN